MRIITLSFILLQIELTIRLRTIKNKKVGKKSVENVLVDNLLAFSDSFN